MRELITFMPGKLGLKYLSTVLIGMELLRFSKTDLHIQRIEALWLL